MKMLKMLFVGTLIISGVFSVSARAGGIGGGGGDGVTCNGGPFMLFLDKRFYLSDMLTGTVPTFYEKSFSDISEETLTEAVLQTVEKNYPEVRAAYNGLKFKIVDKIPKVETGVKVSWASKIL